MYSKEFSSRISDTINEPVFRQWEHLFNSNEMGNLSKYQYLDIKTFLTDNNLSRVDRMSMANSLEVRLPLLDIGVFNAALKLEPKNRIQGFRTKTMLRRIMKNRLPDRIVRMGKRGFSVPLSLWFRTSLESYVKEILTVERLEATKILSSDIAKPIIEKHSSGKENLNRQIWSLICFVLWYEDARMKGLV